MSEPKDDDLAAPAHSAAVTLEPARRAGLSGRLLGAGRGRGAGVRPARTAQQGPPRRGWLREAAVLAGLLAAGVAVTWPRAAYLAGTLPRNPDQAQYVWSLWWVAHQVTHGGSPWTTGYLAAPVGIQMGFDTLMPLPGVLMAPVTLVFGPSASYNLLAIVTPGLASYAMYRAARLWLSSLWGQVAAGALYGLSGMVAFQAWYHIHTALGCVFLPLALEASVRLRRGPTTGRALLLGVVLGAAMLTDQEFAVLAAILAVLVLVPWLTRHPTAAALRASATAALTAAIIASPQLIAMAQQASVGGHFATPQTPGSDYIRFAAELPSLFAPSAGLRRYGLTGLASIYSAHTPDESLATFGVVLSALAVAGLIVSWRRRSARLLAALWLACAALALGPTLWVGGRQYVPIAQRWHGQAVSLVMPYTWFVRVPGLSSFREADRLAFLGLVGAALLAGAAVEWLRYHARPVLVAAVLLAALEAGWPGLPNQATMPTALPAVDRPIAADRSGSIVVDVPFGIRALSRYGKPISPLALVLATADGHPRAVSYTSWVPHRTIAGIRAHAFYAGLVAAQQGKPVTQVGLAAARRDLSGLHVGWLLLWTHWMAPGAKGTRLARLDDPTIARYLAQTGFRFDYQADGVAVYRP
jgi:hypothetical protein